MIQPTKQNAYILFLISAVLILKISPSWALIIGIMHGLILPQPLLLSQTTKTTSAKLLQLSIIFLGAHLNFSSLMTEGTKGFGVTLISILLVLVIGHFIAQAFKLDKNLSTLISVGTSICGGSAISAISPVIKSNHQQMASSLGIIFILNTLAVFIFPWIGERLHLSQEQFGTWAALAIHDTSSVVAACSIFGQTALKYGTTLKLTRALWIIPLTLYFSWSHKTKQKMSIPWFVFLFLGMSLFFTINEGFRFLIPYFMALSKSGLSIALLMIGLGFSKQNLRNLGFKPLLFAVILWIFISLGSLSYVIFS